MAKKIYFLLLIYLTTLELNANEFRHLTTIEGLSQNDINCIFQDSRGFIWIGTNDGLNRYDGYRFKIFRKQPRQQNGLSGNIIQCLTEDNNGNLWIGTSDNGVCKFDVTNNIFTSYSNTSENPNLLYSNRIVRIKADHNGKVWIISHNGINIINTQTNEIIPLPFKEIHHQHISNQSSYLKDICFDKKGDVWLGTTQGIRKIDPFTYKIIKSYFGPKGQRGASRIINWNNDLLILNSKGVQLFNKNTQIFTPILNVTGGKAFEIDKDGQIWIATNDGVILATKVKKSPLRHKIKRVFKSIEEKGGLTKNIVNDLYIDQSGLIWVGTFGGGLNVYNAKRKLFKHYKKNSTKNSLSHNKIRSIREDKYGGLWIGTDGGALNYLPYSKKQNYSQGYIHKNLSVENFSSHGYSLAEDTANNIMWVGTSFPNKIMAFSTQNGHEIDISQWGFKVQKSVFSILIDSNGCLWLGTYDDGLWRVVPDGKGHFKHDNFQKEDKNYSLPSNLIRSLIEDSKGNIWIGTANGLVKIKQKHKYNQEPKFFTYQNNINDPQSLSHDYILPVFESTKGDIWIGTMGGGLNLYKETPDGIGYFETYTSQDGLPNNVIKGILEDDKGELWISSNGGLTKFNIKNKKFFNYDIDDGLQDYEFSELACYKRRNGEMIFGGVKGFNSFFPGQISRDTSATQIVFTQLDILNQPIEIGQTVNGRILLSQDINEMQELQLKYAENSFTVYYAGLHYAAPRKSLYKYMLEGFDKEWILTTSDARFAKYTNLKPGNYTLKVLASNSDGVWNTVPKTIHITVIAPWWLSQYALFAYIVTIVVLLIFFRRFTLIGVQQKNHLLMERFEKEKVQELSQMKLKFFTDISHEFRTPLTLIIGPIEKLIRDQSKMSSDKIKHIHNMIYRNANVLLRLINQLMDFRKFEQGKMRLKASETNLVKFIKDIYTSFEIYADQKQIDFEISFSNQKLLVWIDPEKLEKIMYNLLSNAFKFTPSGGKISIDINEDNKQVYISVSDTGVGMDAQMKSQVFERFYQADKIENKKYGSTGIGLAYTKGLVEMHKGHIVVQSEENKGTQFIVELPKGKDHLNKKEIVENGSFEHIEDAIWLNINKTGHQEKNNKLDTNKEKETLLIVEDNEELRSFIKESLSDLYHIIDAENGEAGLEKCRNENPGLIVSDVMMPQMDGFEMCKAIKKDVNISHTPIILLTAKTSREHTIKGYTLGADSYVSKPFDLEVLKAQIENLLSKREKLKNNFHRKIEVSPSEIATTSMDEKFLGKILHIIESKIGDSELTVEELATEYGISKVVLNRKLKALTGKTAKIFIRSIRLKRAAQLLSTGRYSVADVTYEVGFSDLKYFRTCFKNEIGLSPSDYKRQHTSEENDMN